MKRRGFTLIELLIGMTITVLIISAALSAYFAAVGSWDQSRSRTGSHQTARAVLSLIERDLRAAIPPNAEKGIVFEGDSAVIEGTELSADLVRFSTTGGLSTPYRAQSRNMYEVRYYLDVDEKTNEPSLMMTRKQFASEQEGFEGQTDELAANVVGFDVKYYDGIEFVDDWTFDELPEAVQFSLLLYDFDAEENPLVFTRLVTINTR